MAPRQADTRVQGAVPPGVAMELWQQADDAATCRCPAVLRVESAVLPQQSDGVPAAGNPLLPQLQRTPDGAAKVCPSKA
jgi:hypothetical protein